MIRTALLSVSDKNGIVPFAKALHEQGIKLISTGGTAKLLAENKLPVVEVSSLTKFPEMLDGRVKTLHPMVHGGLLARRDFPEHMAALKEHGIDTIDMLVINLYPFNETVSRENCSFEDAVENIDIGGPAMLRAAAKNHQDVTVLISPADYEPVLAEMKANQNVVSYKTNLSLAKKVFAHTAQYDGAIANYLSSLDDALDHKARSAYPDTLHLAFEKVQEMRYGENPHQSAAFYKDIQPVAGALANYKQLQGKELSYNNIADADSAWECVKSFANNAGGAAACVIIKHANPCGVAVGVNALEAYQKAFKTDPSSAFGGIIAFNVPCDGAAAQEISKQFVEVLIAPSFSDEAKAIFAAKQNVRLLEIPLGDGFNTFDFKRVGGGLLVQSPDAKNVLESEMRVVSKRLPTPSEMNDMLFAWRVAKFVKSNAIVYCANGMTLGIGAGQMSRVDSARMASIKAENAGLSLKGSAVASDAFFPFRDGLDVVVNGGASCAIQPGGSMRDDEIIAAANEHGIAMIFTGTRHFRH
ncbi:bifunctional phosphoribosylaminoimidazolecarboxamide formyltransferase/IMP cyclohydrolase [Polynucleobacter sphagniphilus]|jgi:phosphoribosylaminoimidazolecarboxamide formyltransferase/IMP cyclohydrolase|uniref:Bifunctional purine biosynthesis protein PurH n=1 Tax=Polynucleobacter sphagniphilus TaxID=1743169 RepID=A0AA43S526_9BURK|nr:bifunctional phosphoribosylaminoimidazolecarboxamide formyltransferase/IMP cyclohydrolase [Polynucleobacter sphagniphilus]MDH6155198.1 phosphoribosylaminoimidazolecarboxamide formyltransferase/IMP cyclohydrolase [Polynucleobacter sphagniphilus]MDH6241786.1 phosphoribosylaminoimidazolecarboxamide formyltransferase/IMP cyclohydrolase [Polynucleobacter sphagniphilus]MDH6250152.1 phosphoribosylaminoimidazolecarboxamide formyltransferase/IMP cyclohydrolase [Polynucleobacter sphagniphilus]MDH63031